MAAPGAWGMSVGYNLILHEDENNRNTCMGWPLRTRHGARIPFYQTASLSRCMGWPLHPRHGQGFHPIRQHPRPGVPMTQFQGMEILIEAHKVQVTCLEVTANSKDSDTIPFWRPCSLWSILLLKFYTRSVHSVFHHPVISAGITFSQWHAAWRSSWGQLGKKFHL